MVDPSDLAIGGWGLHHKLYQLMLQRNVVSTPLQPSGILTSTDGNMVIL